MQLWCTEGVKVEEAAVGGADTRKDGPEDPHKSSIGPHEEV